VEKREGADSTSTGRSVKGKEKREEIMVARKRGRKGKEGKKNDDLRFRLLSCVEKKKRSQNQREKRKKKRGSGGKARYLLLLLYSKGIEGEKRIRHPSKERKKTQLSPNHILLAAGRREKE